MPVEERALVAVVDHVGDRLERRAMRVEEVVGPVEVGVADLEHCPGAMEAGRRSAGQVRERRMQRRCPDAAEAGPRREVRRREVRFEGAPVRREGGSTDSHSVLPTHRAVVVTLT